MQQHIQSVKKEIVDQIVSLMIKNNVSISELAKRMKTSPCAVRRLLDYNNTSITLKTIIRVVHALGKKVTIELI